MNKCWHTWRQVVYVIGIIPNSKLETSTFRQLPITSFCKMERIYCKDWIYYRCISLAMLSYQITVHWGKSLRLYGITSSSLEIVYIWFVHEIRIQLLCDIFQKRCIQLSVKTNNVKSNPAISFQTQSMLTSSTHVCQSTIKIYDKTKRRTPSLLQNGKLSLHFFQYHNCVIVWHTITLRIRPFDPSTHDVLKP